MSYLVYMTDLSIAERYLHIVHYNKSLTYAWVDAIFSTISNI